MTRTDLLASTMGAVHPAHRPEPTLLGALATAALFVLLVTAIVYPALTAVGLTGVALGALGVRRLRSSAASRRRLCLPRTSVCVTI